MPIYVVKAKYVGEATVQIEADDPQDAALRVKNGEGDTRRDKFLGWRAEDKWKVEKR